jgi:N-acetylmuramoyl-L-alanine amidase
LALFSSRRIWVVLVAVIVSACAATDPAIVEGDARGLHADDSVTTTDASPSATDPTASSTTLGSTPPASGRDRPGVAVVPPGGAPISAAKNGERQLVMHEGILLAVEEIDGRWFRTTTPCGREAWLRLADVDTTPKASRADTGPGFDLAEATVVVDPGHGGRDWGGVGERISEKGTNLDIAERLRALLTAPQQVDWRTGELGTGDELPAVAQVWLTRQESGPNGGDVELSLGYRASIANAAGADVFLSLHDNTVPKRTIDRPGTEVFYSVGVAGSDRLAGLIYDEMIRSLSHYEVQWHGGDELGARARTDPDTGDDYYGVLRRAEMPAAIVEGAYISEPDEEALIGTEDFRETYAEAVYRGLVRFLTTDDTSDSINPPQPFPDDAGTVNTDACVEPAQP